jgi:hypothetical protein
MKILTMAGLIVVLLTGVTYAQDYIIEKTSSPTMIQPENPQYYVIKYTKIVKDLEGNDVVIIDEQRTETITKEQLESQKMSYQKAITEIDAKLKRIAEIDLAEDNDELIP